MSNETRLGRTDILRYLSRTNHQTKQKKTNHSLVSFADTGAEAFWHSAPSLEKPPPIAARRQTTRVATSSSPSVLPRLIPPRILPRNAHRNV